MALSIQNLYPIHVTQSDVAFQLIGAASGGTAPYNYQLQRANDVSGAPGSYANIGSSTTTFSTVFSDATGTAGTPYWYSVLVTDSGTPTPLTGNTVAHRSAVLPGSSVLSTTGPYVVQAGLYQNGSGGGTHIINMPVAPAQGNRLLLLVNIGGASQVVTPPSGFSLITSITNANPELLAVYEKVAGASEPTAYTTTNSIFGSAQILLIEVARSAGIDAIATAALTAGVNGTGPSVNTLAPNDLIIGAFGISINFRIDTPVSGYYQIGGSTPGQPMAVMMKNALAGVGTVTGTSVNSEGNSISPLTATIAYRGLVIDANLPATGTVLGQATPTLTAAGVIQATSTPNLPGSGTIQAVGTTNIVGSGVVQALASQTLAALGVIAALASPSLIGTGTISAHATPSIPASGTISAKASTSLPATGTVVGQASSNLPGSGTIQAKAFPTLTARGTILRTVSATLSPTGVIQVKVTKSLPASGTVASTAGSGNTSIPASGTIKAVAGPNLPATGSIAAKNTSHLAATGVVSRVVSTSLSATGTLSAKGLASVLATGTIAAKGTTSLWATGTIVGGHSAKLSLEWTVPIQTKVSVVALLQTKWPYSVTVQTKVPFKVPLF